MLFMLLCLLPPLLLFLLCASLLRRASELNPTTPPGNLLRAPGAWYSLPVISKQTITWEGAWRQPCFYAALNLQITALKKLFGFNPDLSDWVVSFMNSSDFDRTGFLSLTSQLHVRSLLITLSCSADYYRLSCYQGYFALPSIMVPWIPAGGYMLFGQMGQCYLMIMYNL